MHEMQTNVTDDRGVCQSVCLSHGSTRLHCARMAKRIEILFGVNTPGGQENIMLDRGSNVPTGRRSWEKFLPIVDRDPPLHRSISRQTEAVEVRNFVDMSIAGGLNQNYAKEGHTESGSGSRDLFLIFGHGRISGMDEAGRCG